MLRHTNIPVTEPVLQIGLAFGEIPSDVIGNVIVVFRTI